MEARTKDLSDPKPAPVPARDKAPTPDSIQVSPGKGPDITRYFVSSLAESEATPKAVAAAIQRHWGCESQHWRRDVLWREDKCLIRDPNSACVLAIVRVALQSLLAGIGRESLPVVFEDVASDLALGLSWLKERNLRG